MTSKERIGKILKSEPVDRIGILDLDIELLEFPLPKGERVRVRGRESDRFFLFSFNGPFQSLSSKIGLEDALIEFTQRPRHSLSFFKDRQKEIIAKYKRLKAEGRIFNGVWIWEDIAYDKGLYFSIERYRKQLFGLHRDLCDFFASEGLPSFFHCDGKVEDLIPLLVEIRISATHPVQELSNPNFLKIKDDFVRSITFIGGVGLHRLQNGRKELTDYIDRLKEGGNYIFSFDGPIPDNFSKQEYADIIKHIEAQGVYR